MSTVKDPAMENKLNPTKPGRPNYVGVFIALVILTGIEIGVTYLPLPRIPILIPLALAKASLVAMYYMHLKYDKRPFGYIFGMGLFVGIGLILAMVAIFHPVALDQTKGF